MVVWALKKAMLIVVTVLLAGVTVLHACSQPGLSEPIQHISCAVQSGIWKIAFSSLFTKSAGCLLGGKKRCQSVSIVPTADEILPSRLPPDSPDPKYHRLVTIAEKAVPTTWWLKGFDNDRFMFTRDESELPRKQLNLHQPQNVKLRNLYHCVTRESFIRTSFLGNATTEDTECSSKDPNLSEFFALWKIHHATLGGTDPESKSSLLLSATEALQGFLDRFGEDKDRCMAIQQNINCRGALAGTFLYLTV